MATAAAFQPNMSNPFKGTMTQEQINAYMHKYATATGQPYESVVKYATTRPHYQGGAGSYMAPQGGAQYDVTLPAIPAAKPATPAPVVAPVVAPRPVTPTGPAPETPHARALRLAKEGGATAFTRLYGGKAVDPKDPWGVGTEFTRLLTEALGKVPAAENDVTKYVNYDDLFNKAWTTETGNEQNTLRAGVNALAPNYQNTYYADTMDDPFLQSLLTDSYNKTKTTLDNKLNAGLMTQAAYDDAIKQLGYDPTGQHYTGASASAYDTLQGLGGGVLSGYRSGLGDVVSNFNNSIANYSLGQNISPSTLTSNINTYTGSHGNTQMEAAIRNALGNTQLFDVNTISTNANTNTPQTNNPLPATNAPATNAPVTTPATSGTSNSPLGNTAQSPFGSTVAPGTGANGMSAEDERRRTQGTTGVF